LLFPLNDFIIIHNFSITFFDRESIAGIFGAGFRFSAFSSFYGSLGGL
jgi:hypothetical protein